MFTERCVRSVREKRYDTESLTLLVSARSAVNVKRRERHVWRSSETTRRICGCAKASKHFERRHYWKHDPARLDWSPETVADCLRRIGGLAT
jgi:hypothetical protein